MDLGEYNRFLAAACDVAGVMTGDGVELADDGAEGIKLDDESRLMLCVSSPGRLDAVDELVSNFNECYARVSKKEKTA